MGGEIVEVEGGHIVRSRGRKDRHSKVCTAKGPRDRRVRLSAPTAIQFYDVQDRLGYDRPSKALDWLINKAKPAIDQLAQLPPWKPTLPVPLQQQNDDDDVAAEKEKSPSELAEKENLYNNNNNNNNNNQFNPFDTDIADTIRSFFPATTSSPPIQFQIYPPDLLSRTSSQDLRLSLQSFQDSILHQHHHNEHVHFTGNLDGMVAWNSGAAAIDTGNNNNDGAGGGFVFNAPSPSPSPPLMFGQGQYLSPRGPLQSSNTPSVRAWIDAPSFAADHRRHCLSPAAMAHQSSSSFSPSGAGFASGGFSGFRVPARIRGDDEEEHGCVSDKPSSASSHSRR